MSKKDEMNEWDRKYYEQGESLAKDVLKYVNVMGGDDKVAEGFLATVENDHRTLQQSTMGLLWKILTGYEPWGTDARNEACAALSVKLREMIERNELPGGFPLI